MLCIVVIEEQVLVYLLFSKRRIQKLYIVTHNNLQGNVIKLFFFF